MEAVHGLKNTHHAVKLRTPGAIRHVG